MVCTHQFAVNIVQVLDHFLPEDVDALVYRAKAYMYSNNYTSAIADLTEILEQAPENANTLFERGVCFYRLRVWDRAIWDFSSAIEYLAAPNKELEATLYYNRGISYLGAGRYEEAEKDLTHSRFLNEHHAETFIKLAEARVHLGKVEFAKRDLQGLLEQQPNHIEAFSLLAQLNASPVEGT